MVRAAVPALGGREQIHPPAFLRLAGHPVRWRLLRELAHSDRQVRELTDLVERPQNLVSYHLGRLRSAQVVAWRRSSADARDTYYSLNLLRCGELLGSAGGSLHPALRLACPPPVAASASLRPARVLFLCTGNSSRSQIAEGLLQRLAPSADVFSAGSHPKSLHPNAVRVMDQRGINLRGRRAKHLAEFVGHHFDYVITLCDRVREVCPEFLGHTESIHWSMPDPAAAAGSDEDSYPAFERTAAELELRIGFFLHVLRATSEHEVALAHGSKHRQRSVHGQ